MKTIPVVLLTFITALFIGQIAYAQSTKNAKKIRVHEIKLEKRDDGTRVGAMYWQTSLKDSVQKFVLNDIDIFDPVQVILSSFSMGNEVKLVFYGETGRPPLATISSNGKKIGKKVFRTVKSQQLGVTSKVEGIPYMILVTAGKKFPVSDKPLIRVTNDKKAYGLAAKQQNTGKTSVSVALEGEPYSMNEIESKNDNNT